jgi:hypothetical protein
VQRGTFNLDRSLINQIHDVIILCLIVSCSSFVFQFQDFGKSSISCPFQGEEDEIYLRTGTQGSDFADRSYHIVCPAYSFTGSDVKYWNLFPCNCSVIFSIIFHYFLLHIQRDSVGLTNQNNELKFRIQAMEQQAQLRDGMDSPTPFVFAYFLIAFICSVSVRIASVPVVWMYYPWLFPVRCCMKNLRIQN